MPIESRPRMLSTRVRLDRLTHSVEHLNARVARLAQLLQVDLQQPAELERALCIDAIRASEGSGLQRRQRHELRALLVMRYRLAQTYAREYGVEATRCILLCAQEHLVDGGFRPGSFGPDVRSLFAAG